MCVCVYKICELKIWIESHNFYKQNLKTETYLSLNFVKYLGYFPCYLIFSHKHQLISVPEEIGCEKYYGHVLMIMEWWSEISY